MAAPYQVGGYSVQPTQYNYISLYDVVKPNRNSQLVQRWGDQYLTELLSMLGREEVADVQFREGLVVGRQLQVGGGGTAVVRLQVERAATHQPVARILGSGELGGQGGHGGQGDQLLAHVGTPSLVFRLQKG